MWVARCDGLSIGSPSHVEWEDSIAGVSLLHIASLIPTIPVCVESDERVYCLSKAEASRERRI